MTASSETPIYDQLVKELASKPEPEPKPKPAPAKRKRKLP